MEERIAEMAIAWWHSERDQVIEWLTALGYLPAWQSEDDVAFDGAAGARVGMPVSGADPINAAVSLGLILVGPFWPMAFPSLLKAVGRRWKEST